MDDVSRISGCSIDAIIFMLSNPEFVGWCKDMAKKLHLQLQRVFIKRETFASINIPKYNIKIFYISFHFILLITFEVPENSDLQMENGSDSHEIC